MIQVPGAYSIKKFKAVFVLGKPYQPGLTILSIVKFSKTIKKCDTQFNDIQDYGSQYFVRLC